MAFDSARNNTPSAIPVANARVQAGPDLTLANSIKAFGTIGGQVYEGKLEADQQSELQAAGNEIAALNSDKVKAKVDDRTPSLTYGQTIGVDISAADPTGTIDTTSARFKALEQARLQGKITQQRAELQADTILRQSITKAPGFADQLRAAAQKELGFNPSGAALNQLYLSGPDATKTLPKTQEQKWMETAQGYVDAGIYPNLQQAFQFVAQSDINQKNNANEQLAIARGERNTAQVVAAARVDTTDAFGGILLGAITQIAQTGAVGNARELEGALAMAAERSKNKWSSTLASSKDYVYPQSTTDAVFKNIEDQHKAYLSILQDNDLLKVIKDHRDEVMALTQIKGIDLAPDLAAINAAGGRPAVETWLKFQALTKGDPKSAAELVKASPQYAYLAGISARVPHASEILMEGISGTLGQKVASGARDVKDAGGILKYLTQDAIQTGDPVSVDKVISQDAQAGLPNLSLSAAAHAPNSFQNASPASRTAVQQIFPTNLQLTKNKLGAKLANTGWELAYDGKKFNIVQRNPATHDFAFNIAATIGGDPFAPNYAQQQAPNAVGPDVAQELDVLNNQAIPLLRQAGWSNAIYGSDFDMNKFNADTVRDTNLRAFNQEFTGGENPEMLKIPSLKDQADISMAIGDAQRTGDTSKLVELLSKQGIKLDVGTNLPQTNPSTPPTAAEAQSGTVQRPGAAIETQPGDSGLGTFSPKGKLSTAQTQAAGLVTKAATAEDIDPNVLLALTFQESSLNPSAKNTEKKGNTASGLGGMIDSTANELGVDKSTPEGQAAGAAKYFKMLLDQEGGDYELAIQRYHHGPNGKVNDSDKEYAAQVMSHLKAIPNMFNAGSNAPTSEDLKANFF